MFNCIPPLWNSADIGFVTSVYHIGALIHRKCILTTCGSVTYGKPRTWMSETQDIPTVYQDILTQIN